MFDKTRLGTARLVDYLLITVFFTEIDVRSTCTGLATAVTSEERDDVPGRCLSEENSSVKRFVPERRT